MQHVYTLTEREVKMVSGGEIGFDRKGTVLTAAGIAIGVISKFAIDNYASINIKQKVDYAVDSFLYYTKVLKQLEIIKVVFFPYYVSSYDTATISAEIRFECGKAKSN